jgi:general L-amino acid transport system permease protein
LIGILIAYSMIAPFIQFALIDAVWTGENREACLPQEGGTAGACWAYVKAYFPQFIYGRYPTEEIWRVNIVYALLLCFWCRWRSRVHPSSAPMRSCSWSSSRSSPTSC